MILRSSGDRRGWPLGVGFAGCVVAADLASKSWARHHLVAGTTSTTGPVRLQLVSNRGAAFGVGSAHPLIVAALAALVAAGAVWWFARAGGVGERVALAAVLGGALGNVIDRVARGAVTDWIHVSGYPATFNLADLAVRGGALGLIALATGRRTARGSQLFPASAPLDRWGADA